LRDMNDYFDITRMYIDQPIALDDVKNVMFMTQGVVSVNNMKIINLVGVINNQSYSDVTFDVDANTRLNFVVPPVGGMFELKNADINIIGRAI
jgi:hypothetical protein